ncbi:hypothetical protein A3F00_05325 [Candidatus Daviesbacteria bacterium RIFCSPHIGHO2_12_FULL_37_11]|uniref:Plasmid stabilization protein n=1 Tax=Candidatus Daviesbacteria bacterium RIFCSPHIGHO2_12_FULL_37_11 TaxID=1797777 RepID=A0A1F5KAF7_9BACT|nr:MAG: hypothetical protein A2111_01765 [Candidatus Daviesbacteria bacterium GWA1_38_6]OGE17382.1 MAG: hypothetical protein A2769_00885 [Candidatus Daviesbacteria bacterium RIFCSPHIGHO2_01_FULL_37_27]OGE37798.1 MAG: hypothetical protein A3F00_05325 [Candidatus Daviesbacteria bacterium RIFCSPHIGHO2_12_FULL_37_11]
MKFSFEPELFRKIQEINKKNPKLSKKIQKQLRLFSIDPKYPSLKAHKLKGGLSERWSIYIEENMRMIYYLNVDEAVFFDIGTHDEVYRRK